MKKRKTKAELEILKKQAEFLFVHKNMLQKEIAEQLNLTEKTVGNWVNLYKWKEQQAAVVMSKPQQLALIYEQIAELNNAIKNKEKGKRYANSKEADALKKLTSAAKDLEGELGLSEIINVSIPVLKFIKKIDFKHSQILQNYIDLFIKEMLHDKN